MAAACPFVVAPIDSVIIGMFLVLFNVGTIVYIVIWFSAARSCGSGTTSS